jgi:hypothetical protein
MIFISLCFTDLSFLFFPDVYLQLSYVCTVECVRPRLPAIVHTDTTYTHSLRGMGSAKNAPEGVFCGTSHITATGDN